MRRQGAVTLANPAGRHPVRGPTVTTYDDLLDASTCPVMAKRRSIPRLPWRAVRLRDQRDYWLDSEVHPVAEVAGRTGTAARRRTDRRDARHDPGDARPRPSSDPDPAR